MTALQIEDQKSFTSGLFVGEVFDAFLVREVHMVTFNRFAIDGRVRKGYYSDEERKENQIEEFSSWKTLKPFCFSLLKGKHLPESFRIVFMMSSEAKERFIKKRLPDMEAGMVSGLYLNVQYENNEMTVVTGISMNTFTMDKTLEREWDESVKIFLKKHGIVWREN